MSLLQIKNLKFSYGNNEILKRLDLEVPEGETLALLGLSGSGKTSLLRLIAGLETASSGDIWLRDELVEGERFVPCEQRRVGFVFQDFALFEHLTAFENIHYGCKGDRHRDRANQLIEVLALQDHLDKKPKALSGGEKQRVALARTLALEPDLVLLDEPFASIDRQRTKKLVQELRELFKNLKVTAIMVTHAVEEAIGFADRLCVMHEGKILQTGTAKELFTNPSSPIVEELTGGGWVMEVKVKNGKLQTPWGEMPNPEKKENNPQTILIQKSSVWLDRV